MHRGGVPFQLIANKLLYNHRVKPLALYQRNLIFHMMTIKVQIFDNFQVQVIPYQVKNTIYCESPQINITGESSW